MPIIPKLRRLRQKAQKFKASLGNVARLCLKNPITTILMIIMMILHFKRIVQLLDARTLLVGIIEFLNLRTLTDLYFTPTRV
jgi:hypothetical protein